MDAIIGVRGTSNCFAMSEINIVVLNYVDKVLNYVVLLVSIYIDSR